MSESFSTDSEEEVVDVTPNTITVQLSLDYSFNGNETESEFDRSYIHTNQLDQTKKLKQFSLRRKKTFLMHSKILRRLSL